MIREWSYLDLYIYIAGTVIFSARKNLVLHSFIMISWQRGWSPYWNSIVEKNTKQICVSKYIVMKTDNINNPLTLYPRWIGITSAMINKGRVWKYYCWKLWYLTKSKDKFWWFKIHASSICFWKYWQYLNYHSIYSYSWILVVVSSLDKYLM